ncbi:hypothetical protein IRB79_27895 (plasmid) [Cytobacillus oceanisediminis]|nr:hypothetical protein IRB79_27895 [Cytobacillus oceanisediminis]
MDYDDLATTIKYLLDASWGPEWGNFSPDGPNVTDPTNVDYPVIVHYMSEMMPGKIGTSTRELKPRHRYFATNDEAGGGQPQAVRIYGQVFDAEVVFEIWEETNASAARLAKQFRQTLAAFTGYLKEKGLKEIQFLRMETDLSNSRIKDNYKIRRLVYFVRFEELTEVPTELFQIIEVVENRLQKDAEGQLQKQIGE